MRRGHKTDTYPRKRAITRGPPHPAQTAAFAGHTCPPVASRVHPKIALGSMVRKGSTVRVRARALRKLRSVGDFLCPEPERLGRRVIRPRVRDLGVLGELALAPAGRRSTASHRGTARSGRGPCRGSRARQLRAAPSGLRERSRRSCQGRHTRAHHGAFDDQRLPQASHPAPDSPCQRSVSGTEERERYHGNSVWPAVRGRAGGHDDAVK